MSKIIASVLILFFLSYCLLDNGFAIEPPSNNEQEIQKDQNNKILLIPLDSRPVNTTYVSLLGEIAGIQVIYPRSGLDCYTIPADFPVIEEFLIDHIQSVDGVIIGIPEWLNGGIIQARNVQSYLKNQYRMDRLKGILSSYPEKKVYLINLIPREIPSYTPSSFAYGSEMIPFGKQYQIGIADTPPFIDEYMNLFAENYKVTRELINWVEMGIADELLIGMDDTGFSGMTKITERKIQDYITEKNIPNVSIMSGADELSALLLARYKNELTQKGSTYSITYSCPLDENNIYPYDGRKVAQVVQEKIDFVQPFSSIHNYPVQLYIHSSEEPITNLVQWADTHKNEIKGVANMAFAYTPITWMEDFFYYNLDEQIESFSGWNTGANTLGLLIAHLEMIKDLHTWNNHHEQWVFLRYIEDYYYNLYKRKEYSSTYSPFYRLSPLEEKKLTKKLYKGSNALLKNLSIVTRQGGEKYAIPSQYDITQIDLPWNRIYEISCTFNKKETD